MGRRKSQDRDGDLSARVELLWIAESGVLDAIPCPSCGERSVSVRFTRPADDVYRTWFVCSKCEFRLRAENSGRPKYYADDLVDEELQVYDRKVLSKKRLGKK